MLIVQGKEHKSDQPAFLEVIFVDADGGFRKLATFLEKSLDVLFAVNSSYVPAYDPIALKVHYAGYAAGMYTIDFEEMTHNPLVGFILRKSIMLDMPVLSWDPVGVGYQLYVPYTNWRRFQFAADPSLEPRAFYSIQPVINNPP